MALINTGFPTQYPILIPAMDLDFEKDANIPVFLLNHINDSDILKIMSKISDAKATGHDGLPIRFLKMTK